MSLHTSVPEVSLLAFFWNGVGLPRNSFPYGIQSVPNSGNSIKSVSFFKVVIYIFEVKSLLSMDRLLHGSHRRFSR